ncbi:hypothetical protein EC988_009089, partial [Linderina pennispora]
QWALLAAAAAGTDCNTVSAIEPPYGSVPGIRVTIRPAAAAAPTERVLRPAHVGHVLPHQWPLCAGRAWARCVVLPL